MLTPQEVSTHAFTKSAFSGYNMAMVDEFLDELTDDYTALYKENAALKAKMKVLAEKVEDYRATEDSMRATLLTAQKMADSIVKEAEDRRNQAMTAIEAETRQRVEQAKAETAAEMEKLRQGKLELARFIVQSRKICTEQLALLDLLPQLELGTGVEETSAQAPAEVEEVAQAPQGQPEPEVAVQEADFPVEENVEKIVGEALRFGKNNT